MKFRLILISCILSIIPLLIFQVYYYYSTERMIFENQSQTNISEIRSSAEDISDKINSSLDTIGLFAQLSLPKVSIEFNRPEAMNEFLSASNEKNRSFERIVVLDSRYEFFASSNSSSDVFDIIEDNQIFKDVAEVLSLDEINEVAFYPKFHDNELLSFFVAAKVYDDSRNAIGYFVAKINKALLVNSIERLKQRINTKNITYKSFNILPNSNVEDLICSPISVKSNSEAQLCVGPLSSGVTSWIQKNLLILVITALLQVILYALIYQFLIGRILAPLYQFLGNLTKITEGAFIKQKQDSKFSEINTLISSTNSIVEKLKSSQEQEIEKVKIEAVAKVATQAAHDIRSPLEVLKSLNEEMENFPDSTKRRIQLSINRIEEITFNLLKTHKESSGITPKTRSEELLNIVNSTITEKHIEYRNLENLQILDNLNSNSFGICSKINRASLKSVLSNLINNGIESFDSASGIIRISLDHESDKCFIKVSDNGPGINSDVMAKLFTKGFTTKKTGNGIGLYNAKLEIEAVGGTIVCESEVGKGTTFTISLPKSEAPASFVASIDAYKYERIIVLDDDPAFHEVWSKRLEGLESKVEHIHSVEEMLSKYQRLHPKILLLSDFELMDKELDGIDTILKLNHAEHSILVTARNEEQAIQDRCLKGGIKLLPKSLVNYVMVRMTGMPMSTGSEGIGDGQGGNLSESSQAQLGIASMVGDDVGASISVSEVLKFGSFLNPEATKFGHVEGTQGREGESYNEYGDHAVTRSSDAQDGKNQTAIVLIDDDRLVHINWASHCKKKGLAFQGFMSINAFLAASATFDKASRIYIDSNLGDGIKGEIESEKIFALGFLHLYLATGYEKDSISKPSWIKEIYSKSPENIES